MTLAAIEAVAATLPQLDMPLDLNPEPRRLAYDLYLIDKRLARVEAWLAKHNAGEN